MGTNSRRKGATFERTVAQILRQVYPDAKRGFQFRAGTDAPDVISCGGWWVECKHGARTNAVAAHAQAVAASDGRTPLVITRDNRGPILVTVAEFAYWRRIVRNRDTWAIYEHTDARTTSAAVVWRAAMAWAKANKVSGEFYRVCAKWAQQPSGGALVTVPIGVFLEFADDSGNHATE